MAGVSDYRAHRSIVGRSLAIGIASLFLTIFTVACSLHKSSSPPPTPPPQVADNAPLPGPEAKIHISYARPDDYLDSLLVSKYSAAENVMTLDDKDGRTASIIRFDGGVGVWQVDVDKSMFSDFPVIGSDKAYAPADVKYGSVPARFLQSVPWGEPPEPLEADRFYIFTVTRALGSTSYEAVKVDTDGSLETYEAEPRAGTSFRLCCNLGADFTATTTPAGGGLNGP
jgi:hypothetical protein